jgi:hypothetical protein
MAGLVFHSEDEEDIPLLVAIFRSLATSAMF